VVGKKAGRTDGVAVFDSTGLAIQDVAAAHVVYEDATGDSDGGTRCRSCRSDTDSSRLFPVIAADGERDHRYTVS